MLNSFNKGNVLSDNSFKPKQNKTVQKIEKNLICGMKYHYLIVEFDYHIFELYILHEQIIQTNTVQLFLHRILLFFFQRAT